MSDVYSGPTSFFDANADPGSPGSYAQMLWRQKIAEALAKERPYPKNVGEGITAIGEALGQQRAYEQWQAQARALAALEAKRKLAGGDPARDTYATGAPAPTAAAPPPPVAAQPPPVVPPAPAPAPAQQAAPPPPPQPALTPENALQGPGVPTVPAQGGIPEVPPSFYAGPNMVDTAARTFGAMPRTPEQRARDRLALQMMGRPEGDVLPADTVGSQDASTYDPTRPDNPFGASDAVATDAVSPVTQSEEQAQNIPEEQAAEVPAELPREVPSRQPTRLAEETANRILAQPPPIEEVPTTSRDPFAERFGFPTPPPEIDPNSFFEGRQPALPYRIPIAQNLRMLPPALPPAPPQAAPPVRAAAPGQAVNTPAVLQIPKAPTSVQAASGLLPSQEAIAYPRDPGAEPRPPGNLPMSRAQAYYLQEANNPEMSADYRKAMMKNFEIQEVYRKKAESDRYEQFRAAHENWVKLYNEANDPLGIQTKRQQIEAQRGTITGQSLENVIKENTVGQIPVANATAAAELRNKLVMEANNGRKYLYDQRTGEYTDITPEQRVEDIKTSETQDRTLKALERAQFAMDQYNKIGGDAAARGLEGFVSSIGSRVPIIGNALQTNLYQQAKSAQLTWLQAVLRDESGAVISLEEAENKRHVYFPEPFDGPEEIRNKRERRENEIRSLVDSLGTAKPRATQYLETRPKTEAGTPVVSPEPVQSTPEKLPVLTPEQAAMAPSGTKFITIDGRPRTIK